MATAVELEPDVAHFALVYGVALHSAGRRDEALRVLEEARRRAPADPELSAAIASLGGR